MATLVTTPVELYLHTSYEPDAEFVDGEVEERPMGEYDHATWQQAIQLWFNSHAKEWGVRVRAELRVQVSPTNYRVPDVVVFDRDRATEQILTHPPIAVFEVLSPEDTMTRIMRKLADYAMMGIRNIFVLDPRTEIAYRYTEGSLDVSRDQEQLLEGSTARVDWRAISELRD